MDKSWISKLQNTNDFKISLSRMLDFSVKNSVVGFIKTGDVLCPDLISELPESIIEIILIKLPIRDALRTSILSSKWKHKWSSITHLVFDEKSVPICYDQQALQESVVKFISRVLFLHQGPVHKFEITHFFLQSCPEIDQWILFLSRKDIQDLTLELGNDEYFRMPSCLFTCQKLTRLNLSCCELDLPHSFKGFPCLNSLSFNRVFTPPEAIERLISSCPRLEKFSLIWCDSLALTIRAPQLKYLFLKGEFKDLCLVDTPLLVELSVSMYMTHDLAEHVELSSNCNFVKFLGSVPNLERFDSFMDFTKYLSIGNHDLRHLAIMFNNLERIQMAPVNFSDMKERRTVLRLITSSPNLKKLCISGSSDVAASTSKEDMDFWKNECPSDSVLSKLKFVDLEDMSGVLHEIEFIKFLLGCSPVLETMIIIPSILDKECQLKMLIELMKFPRASSKAGINFIRSNYPIILSPSSID
ncbi:unnamed protein product [Trifolium pratense]|uniref:Uncharacterized protein n=1 Tax=Trifolium pratense TaxID=57577 RepID=A0ACB0JT95_TRIPR|nr:unnamed protein product [Trifolium pratense]